MKLLSALLIATVLLAVSSAQETNPKNETKQKSMMQLAPPLQMDPSCRIIGCYRNMLNMSNNCDKGEFLHSFKKCDKKFYREETCCKKTTEGQ